MIVRYIKPSSRVEYVSLGFGRFSWASFAAYTVSLVSLFLYVDLQQYAARVLDVD